MLECAFCGDAIEDGQPYRSVPVSPDRAIAEPMHDEPRLCAIRYEFSMLAARLDSAMRKGAIDRPAAPISRVEFNQTFSGELLMLLQKWHLNREAQERFAEMSEIAKEASQRGESTITMLFGGVAEMNEATLKAAVDRRAASEELERAVMVASDALYDAVFGKEAQ